MIDFSPVCLGIMAAAGPTSESMSYQVVIWLPVRAPHQKRPGLSPLLYLSGLKTTAVHSIRREALLLDRRFGDVIARTG